MGTEVKVDTERISSEMRQQQIAVTTLEYTAGEGRGLNYQGEVTSEVGDFQFLLTNRYKSSDVKGGAPQ